MKWLNKNNVIIVLSISLFSTLLIKGEEQLINGTENILSNNGLKGLNPLNRDMKKVGNFVVKTNSTLNNSQIIDNLKHKKVLTVLQTLSYLWTHIDQYKQHRQIMAGVEYLAKSANDKRISGLATLVSGRLIQQKKIEIENSIVSNEQWEFLEQEGLVTQEDQSESDYEKLDSSPIVKENLIDSDNNQEREQYIDNLLSHNNNPDIDEIATLIQDIDDEVSIAAVDTLISFLNQGVGDPKEIVEVIEENIALLDELQIQSFEEILYETSKLKDDE